MGPTASRQVCRCCCKKDDHKSDDDGGHFPPNNGGGGGGGGGGDIVWDDTATFQDHLSRGTIMAALQWMASLFAESGIADAVDITVETSILQQVSTFHVPVQLLLTALDNELRPKPGASPAELAYHDSFMLSAGSSKAPPLFAKKVSELEASVKSATGTSDALRDKLSSIDWDKLKRILETLDKDGLDSLDKLSAVIRCTKPMIQSFKTVAQAAKAFWATATVVKKDIDDMKAGKIHVVDFCKHLEACAATATRLGHALQAAIAATKAFVVASEALVKSIQNLVEKLKGASSEHTAAVEAQLAQLRELPAVALGAATGTDASGALVKLLEADLLKAVEELSTDAMDAVLAVLEGNFCQAEWQAKLRETLIKAMASLVRDTVQGVLSKAVQLAATVTGGTVSHTVGFHFETWLSMQFTIVVDLQKVAEKLSANGGVLLAL